MKKRKIINIIGIILIVAIFYLAGIFFPNKARIGYYKHIDDKGKFYKDADRNIEKRVYIYEDDKKEHMPFLNMYCDDVLVYDWSTSGLTLPVDYFRPAGMYDEKIVYYSHNKFAFKTYSQNGKVNTIYCNFNDKYITLTDLKGQKITYKWIGLLCNPEEHEKKDYTKKYGEYILKDSEELSLKEIKENRNKRYIFYGADILFVFALVFYNVRCHKKSTQNIDFGDEG
ncbi:MULTISPECIES: hypothetical protein [Clostridia]|jgi:hypothetical protein|uniref:DUF5050 domain-containing protein n=1 Tax=Butyribacter intestini TaxID=1703332 RepID=A0AAW3JPC3_9FIRM|nr:MULTISPECIES: hypothetical protein [Clostridia]KQC84231.1 hypothetical protein APZ18_13035 [Butyribacter intestini]RHP23738.1 hypothetical protein DWZ63_12040 [Clostridium sp. AF34-13]RHU72288.1 hypothetical protein DXC30_13240 [Butyribacter intestini]